jgi:hypothetical protein
LKYDVKTFEVDPHRRGGIGEPPVEERIRRQEETEFIVDKRPGNREKG